MITYDKDGKPRVERGKLEIPPGVKASDCTIEYYAGVVLENPRAASRLSATSTTDPEPSIWQPANMVILS